MFENINVIGEPRVLSTDAEVDQAQHALGSRFPTGYREYVTQFGEGILGGVYIRIYPPHQILHGENSQANWLDRINQYWFWDDDKELMPKEKALQCIIIGDTYDGDELIIHPGILSAFMCCRDTAKPHWLPATDWWKRLNGCAVRTF